MSEIVIDHPAGEASGLLTIENTSVLEAHGWETGFWICGDEQPVDKALGALGRSGIPGNGRLRSPSVIR